MSKEASLTSEERYPDEYSQGYCIGGFKASYCINLGEQTEDIMNIEKTVKDLLMWDQSNGNGPFATLRTALKRMFLRADLSNRIRYDPVLEHVEKYRLAGAGILEVGCGSVGITRYLNCPVTGADLDFQGPQLPYLRQVRCSAGKMPFRNEEFDLTLSVDMLEHVPKDLRHSVISEMIRVSKEWIIIGVPSGKNAESWEDRAWNFWHKKIQSCSNPLLKGRLLRRGNFLEEHRKNGLPTESEIIKDINDASMDSADISIVHNQSVLLWYIMAVASLRYSQLLWLTSIVIGRLLSPFLRRVKWQGCYRSFIIVRKARFQK